MNQVMMWYVLVCVWCVQSEGSLMNITQHAGADEAHNVFSSLLEDHVSVTAPSKAFRNPDVLHRTVSVICRSSTMDVHVKADLFNLGRPVDPQHITLGESCGVTETSPEELIIHAALSDCGTHYWMTADALIYTNTLLYSPIPSVPGVIRHETMSILVECVYRRRFGVDSVSLVPIWLPHLSAPSVEQFLHFMLRLMTSDWQVVRGGVYFLGDVINIEASVFAPLLELRVYVHDCVATATPDVNSLPRYNFIQNGCFTDGEQTSSTSQFLPRTRSNTLHLQLHTFIFRQVQSAQVFISCHLKADLQSSSSSRACSYIHGSWRSADGDHSVCEGCWMSEMSQMQKVGERWAITHNASMHLDSEEQEHRTSGSTWKNPEHADPHGVQEFHQDVQVGPLSLSPWRSELSPPTVLEGVHVTHIPALKIKRLTSHTQQDNTSTLASESENSTAKEKPEKEVGVSFAMPTPACCPTVPPTFTTAGTTNLVSETRASTVTPEAPSGAVSSLFPADPVWQHTEHNSTQRGEDGTGWDMPNEARGHSEETPL